MLRRPILLAVLLAAGALTGCDMLGIDTPEKIAAQKEAEGKAIGAACRHANRAIEDCFTMNRRAEKAAIFAGWKDMNDYMRENKIEPVTPQGSVPVASASAEPGDDAAAQADTPRRSDKPSARSKSGRHES
jgi:hypothetical protein